MGEQSQDGVQRFRQGQPVNVKTVYRLFKLKGRSGIYWRAPS
jgi:hypothetical protein